MSELLFVEADGLFPYRNQALEEALFETLPCWPTCTLFAAASPLLA